MSKNNKVIYVIVTAVIMIIAVLVWVFAKGPTGESPLDEFTKCLTEKGAKLYTTSWCSHCTTQKDLFGTSLAYIDSTVCDLSATEKAKCEDAEITSIPAWDFPDGTRETGVRTFEQLTEKTGCQLTQE